MPDLQNFVYDVAGRVVTPDFDDLVGTVRARRRQRLGVGLAAVAAAAVAIALVVAPDTRGSRDTAPADQPGSGAAWGRTYAAEEIVGHPQAKVVESVVSPDEPGVRVDVWGRCLPDAPACSLYGREAPVRPYRAEYALEVIGPRNSFLTEVDACCDFQREVVPLGGTAFLWVSDLLLSPDNDGPVLIPTTEGFVSPRPGIVHHPCGDANKRCVFDSRVMTMTRLRLPSGVDWAEDTRDGFWGVAESQAVIQQDDLTFERLQIPIARGSSLYPADGGAQGEVALWEVPDLPRDRQGPQADADDYRRLAEQGRIRLHVSLDRGAMWDVRVVPATHEAVTWNGVSSLPADWRTWPTAPAS